MIRNSSFFSILFIWAVLFSAQAVAYPVNDPEDILGQVDTFLGEPSFYDDFKLNERVQVTNSWEGIENNLEVSIESVHADDVHIISQSESSGYKRYVTTKEQYENRHGSLLRYFLETGEVFGNEDVFRLLTLLKTESSFNMLSLEPTTVHLPRQSIDAVIVSMEFYDEGLNRTPITWTIGKDISALSQVLRQEFHYLDTVSVTRVVDIL